MTKPHSFTKTVRLFLTGFAMGTADLIPGVSGGTVAFLSGIYEELLYSVKLMTGKVLKLFLKLKIAQGLRHIPFTFLLPLAFGLFSAIILLSKILSYLLTFHPVPIWSFFFGLILASTMVVLRRVTAWHAGTLGVFVLSAISAYILVGAVPVETPETLPFFFFSGAIAICAMILPGISGSFILLLLGKYQQILTAVNNRDILTIFVFMIGCAVGIALFSRILTYLFATYHNVLVAALAGFMLGSIRKIWPWKEVIMTRVNSHGEVVPLLEKNVLPPFTIDVFVALLFCAFAFFLVWWMQKLQLTREQTQDIADREFKELIKKSQQ
jgi:putative membrane protein